MAYLARKKAGYCNIAIKLFQRGMSGALPSRVQGGELHQRAVHLEKLSLNFSILSFVIGVYPLHP